MSLFTGSLVPNMEGYQRKDDSGFMIKQKRDVFVVYGVLEDLNNPDTYRALDYDEREIVE